MCDSQRVSHLRAEAHETGLRWDSEQACVCRERYGAGHCRVMMLGEKQETGDSDSGFFSGTGILAPELILWKTSGTSGEGSPICRTWLNRGSGGVRPGRRFRLESISSRCLTPASWMTRESEVPGPLQDKLIRFLGWDEGEVLPRLRSLWRKIFLGPGVSSGRIEL